ncbi:hypothetical protein C8A03DRAFT_35525 [Achaetomium macrosporum]|uniref:Uncharacterized protein n=1 Tax=Achaetomium macrosporum TaxID=79813 RepID=A0AAN7C6X7_9PEZI|nr:hypothetical protein C8A03DRAFT_35525 [Achaetomium macrosporum]
MLLLSATLLPDNTSSPEAALAIGVPGNGSDIMPTLIAVIANSTPEDQATIMGCSYPGLPRRSLGLMAGLCISSIVVQNAAQDHLVGGWRASQG